MRSPIVPLLLVLGLMLAGIADARAQAIRIDDSASQVLTPGQVPMQWRSVVPRPGEPPIIVGQVTVRVVLDLSKWVGRRGRIYHVLAPSNAGNVVARWTSDGTLAPGTVRDGQRTLVFDGVITTARLVDTFRLVIEADGERVTRPQALEFGFELELEDAR